MLFTLRSYIFILYGIVIRIVDSISGFLITGLILYVIAVRFTGASAVQRTVDVSVKTVFIFVKRRHVDGFSAQRPFKIVVEAGFCRVTVLNGIARLVGRPCGGIVNIRICHKRRGSFAVKPFIACFQSCAVAQLQIFI